MVVDTSALVAIFLLEPEAERFANAILDAPRAMISAANLLEAAIILDPRIGREDSTELEEFISNVGVEVDPVTAAHARAARQAYRTYGRGKHPAGLNFGDCFAYALAKTTGSPCCSKATISRRRTSHLRSDATEIAPGRYPLRSLLRSTACGPPGILRPSSRFLIRDA